jgi:hypothetical protein
MEVEAILQELIYFEWGEFPREALEAAIAQQEAITPHLLRALKDAPGLLERLATEENYMLPTYAFYLLAQFRETRAYPLIVDFFSQPGRQPVDITGDFVTEDLGRVLASVSGGDTAPIKSLIENPKVNEYTRAAAMDSLLTLFVEGVLSREAIHDYFRDLFQGGLERDFSHTWNVLVSHSCDLYLKELMPDIRKAFADNLVDEFFIDLRWIKRKLAEGKEETLASLRANHHYHYINDTISEMEGWHCFQSPRPSPSPSPPPEPSSSSSQVTPRPAPPPKKVGRNDPCPCGSGRKYKHCCGKRT